MVIRIQCILEMINVLEELTLKEYPEVAEPQALYDCDL